MSEAQFDATQRYWNAVRKAQIRGHRNIRLALAGKIGFIPCSHPEPDLIKAIAKAYRDGLAQGRASSPPPKEA